MRDQLCEFEGLIDAEQVAELLRIHPKTVRRMARQRILPAIRVAKFWRFRKSDLAAWTQSGVNCGRYAYRQIEEVKS